MGASPRPPDYISLEKHRDDHHSVERLLRWVLVTLLTAFAILGLANAFGQQPSETRVGAAGATFAVSAPDDLRGGLFFQGRFEIVARDAIRSPTLRLASGWFDGIHLNTIEPEPTGTGPEDGGDVTLEFDPLPAGKTLTVYLELQVNPTSVGRRDQSAELRDGDRTLASVDRRVTIFP